MTERAAYLAEETTWLMSFGRPPLEIAAQLNTKPRALYDLALKYGLEDIRAAFSPFSKGVKA